MFRSLAITVGLLCLASGCERTPVSLLATDPAAASPQLARDFDAAKTGTIRGNVRWDGPLPEVPPIQAVTTRQLSGRMIPNPYTPRIHPESRGVAGAVVFLEAVNLTRAKPWDLPPASIVVDEEQITVRMGDGLGLPAGVARVGTPVHMVSASPWHQMLRARGAAYWTIPFPQPNRPCTRVFTKPGRVVFTNGAGNYWQSATLFVDDHPYYTFTDEKGRFQLQQVPEGSYTIKISLSNWQIAGQERDPETGLILRQQYQPAVIRSIPCTVQAGKTSDLNPAFTTADFSP